MTDIIDFETKRLRREAEYEKATHAEAITLLTRVANFWARLNLKQTTGRFMTDTGVEILITITPILTTPKEGA